MSTLIDQYNADLYHYGVKGMKWGVSRGKVEQTYSKAIRKREKLIDAAAKYKLRGAKLTNKATGIASVVTNRIPVLKQLNNVNRMRGASLSYRGAKLEKRARKLDKSIDKVFSGYTIAKIPNRNIDAGKSILYRMLYGNDGYDVTKRD